LQWRREGLRPDAQNLLPPVSVSGVNSHDDEIGDKQGHEPDGSSLSNLFLCANKSHALTTDYTDH
jgi:hypothetical protein